jgi:peptidoglycan/xylan/chitin deacetylase (PgdA/CDA1 family)
MLGMRCERRDVLSQKTMLIWQYSGLHGYTHEFVSTLNEQQQRDILSKSIDVLTKFLGKKPKGWTAPAWDTSKQTIKLLEEYGVVSSSTSTTQIFPN